MNFESMTYENIMADMMADMPDGVSTREGSLLYNACVKQALKLEEAYIAMSIIYQNINIDTMDEEHLIPFGEQKFVFRKEASHATVKGEFKQDIEIGTRFSAKQENFVVTKKIDGYTYELECETTGIGGNILGTLELIDFVQDYKGGKITEILIPGEEKEDMEEVRKKIKDSYGSKIFAGNKTAYKTYINAIEGVGGCRIKRREENDKYIRPCIMASNLSPPTQSLIDRVQTIIDPEQNKGEGNGTAPIDHMVIIEGVEEREIDIKCDLVLETGYDSNEIKVLIEQKIDDYFTKLKQEWEDKEELVIKTYLILADIASINGINDITSIAINGKEENIILKKEIPKRGEVIVSCT